MTFSTTEQEAIVLSAVWLMIDEMVNFAIFMPLNGRTRDIGLMPQTSEARRLLHVLLGDFLSPLSRKGKGGLPFDLPQPPDQQARPSDLTFLFYLRQIVQSPNFNADAGAIGGPVEAFAAWLEEKSYIQGVWLPSIEVEVDLTIARITWIKICADIGKHSFARLESNVGKIVRILADHDKQIDEGMGYTVLPEFWEWFHTHLFAYHTSAIAEFLNNIRWGIFDYLQPEFARAYHVTSRDADIPIYAFHIPAAIDTPLAKTMYWDLMNMARSRPYFPRFTVSQSFKNQF